MTSDLLPRIKWYRITNYTHQYKSYHNDIEGCKYSCTGWRELLWGIIRIIWWIHVSLRSDQDLFTCQYNFHSDTLDIESTTRSMMFKVFSKQMPGGKWKIIVLLTSHFQTTVWELFGHHKALKIFLSLSSSSLGKSLCTWIAKTIQVFLQWCFIHTPFIIKSRAK